MKKVALSLDSSLKEIFTYEESRAVFDKFLPGMRTMAENSPQRWASPFVKSCNFRAEPSPTKLPTRWMQPCVRSNCTVPSRKCPTRR